MKNHRSPWRPHSISPKFPLRSSISSRRRSFNRQRRQTTQIEELLKTHLAVPSTPLHELPFTLETPETEAKPLSELFSIIQKNTKKQKTRLLNAHSDQETDYAIGSRSEFPIQRHILGWGRKVISRSSLFSLMKHTVLSANVQGSLYGAHSCSVNHTDSLEFFYVLRIQGIEPS